MIEFGEPMDAVIKRYLKLGMTAEETANQTSMPLDVVLKSVRTL